MLRKRARKGIPGELCDLACSSTIGYARFGEGIRRMLFGTDLVVLLGVAMLTNETGLHTNSAVMPAVWSCKQDL